MPGRHNQPVARRLLLPTRQAPSFPDAFVSSVQCKKLKHSLRNRGSVTAANEQVFSDKVMPSSSRRATWSASLMQRWRAGSIRSPAGRAAREPLSNRNHSPMARSALDTLQMQTYARTTARRDDPRNGPLERRGGSMKIRTHQRHLPTNDLCTQESTEKWTMTDNHPRVGRRVAAGFSGFKRVDEM